MSDKLKPYGIDQPPLYGCCQCNDEYSWPADDLRVYEGQCWCKGCWDSNCDDNKPEWRSLQKFEPTNTRTDPAKDAMREALNNLADAVDKWNEAVEVIIGRQPETGMATAEARAALALDKEQNGFQRNLATASKIVEKWPDWKKSLLKGSGKEQNDAKP